MFLMEFYMRLSKGLKKIVFYPSSSEREQIDKLKQRFHCKTDHSLFRHLIWFFDDFDDSFSDCQKNINELRSALYESLGIVSK